MKLEETIFATLCTNNKITNPLIKQLQKRGYVLSFADPEPHQGIVDPTLIINGNCYTRGQEIAQLLAYREHRKSMLTGDDRL